MPYRTTLRFAAPALAVAALLGVSASADEFRLEMTRLPAPFLHPGRVNTEPGRVDTVIEASAVEPIDGRRFLIAHDKAAPLHVVDLATGELIGKPLTSAKFPATTKTGPKWEGMARDDDGNYYLVGSHSGKTDEERASRAAVLRFRLKDEESQNPEIDDASVVRWTLDRSLVARLAPHGGKAVDARKIEGLTVRELDGSRELVVGLREPTPSDTVLAYSAKLPAARSEGAGLELTPLFQFRPERCEGVRSTLTSLEHVPALGGFLVVTACEDEDNAFHGNTLWFVFDSWHSGAVKVATFEVAMKAEGVAVLGVDDKNPSHTVVRLLITYDNDAHTTKMPSRFQTATLVRTR